MIVFLCSVQETKSTILKTGCPSPVIGAHVQPRYGERDLKILRNGKFTELVADLARKAG